MKMKNKMKMKMNFHFFFHFIFRFRFVFCFCFLKVFAFLLTPRGHRRSTVSWLAYKCHSVFVKFTWPRSAIDGELSLDWPRSAIVAPRNMAPSLTRICRIQWCCSVFLFSNGNTLFGQIWSKKLKLSP